ncbi:MAG: hypothetical protein R6U43_12025 [Candidatus Krumholzibacteriales bacterium]
MLHYGVFTGIIRNMIRSAGEIMLAAVLTFVMTVSCGGQKKERDSSGVGGCSLDTVVIGTSFRRSEPVPSAAWIRIHSIEFAGELRYRKAVDHLVAAIDSAGVELYSCSELLHIESGPCWPPYTITLRVNAPRREDTEPVRSMLGKGSLNGLIPLEERPPGYGAIFITCGKYAIDWWTVWYSEQAGRRENPAAGPAKD